MEATAAAPTHLKFENKQATSGAQAFSCMTAIYKDKKEFFAIDKGGSPYAYPIPTVARSDFAAGKPVYLTFIPFNGKTEGDCTTDLGGNYDDAGSFIQSPSTARNASGDVIAVWITRPAWTSPPKVNSSVGYATVSTCSIAHDISMDSGLPYTANGCNIQKPKWSVSEDGNFLHYSGSLLEMLGTGQSSNNVVFIDIAPEVTVNAPLTNQYIEYPASFNTSRAACETALESYNANPSSPFPISECANGVVLDGSSDAYRRSYNYSSDTTSKIILTGGGRINGDFIVNVYHDVSGPCDQSSGSNLGSVWSCDHASTDNPDAGGIFPFSDMHVKYAEWKIQSSLLGLSSAYSNVSDPNGNFAIDISQITLSDTPHRNRASAILNVAQFGPKVSLEKNEKPIKIFDFKQVGSWVGANDGPEIGGPNSFVENTYLHIADDSIKASVDGLQYLNSTVLQGDDGGAINIGSYGVTRGVSGGPSNIRVSGVWIPRIVQRCMSEFPLLPDQDCSDQDDINGHFFNASRGVVTAPTCPRVSQKTNPGTSGSLTGVTIESLQVFGLGGGDLGPNSIAAPISIGIQDDYFCHLNFEPGVLATSQYTTGNFVFKDMEFGVNPFLDTFFYMQSQTDALAASFDWEQVAFCEPETTPKSGPTSCQFTSAPLPLKPVQIQSADGYGMPSEFPPSWFYYPCGYPAAQSGGFDQAQCWTTRGEDNGGSSFTPTATNIRFATGKNQSIYNDIVVIPYGAPEPGTGLAGVVALSVLGAIAGRRRSAEITEAP